MLRDDGNLQALTGGLKLKIRIQHPGVHERTDRGGSYWYFRYWEDVLQADGTTKAIRKFHTVGPSKGDTKLSKKQAEVARHCRIEERRRALERERGHAAPRRQGAF